MTTTLKYKVKQFKNFKICLKELEPFIRSGKHLQTGKPFNRFGGMRSRELLANWLLCVAMNYVHQEDRLTFSSDPLGGDGIICDTVTGETWPTEHVLVPRLRIGQTSDAQTLILKAIDQKRSKGGSSYAAGKTLIVFLNADAGVWYPNRLARQLPKPLLFAAVWVISLQAVEKEEYVYSVSSLEVTDSNAPTLIVRISQDFEAWKVIRLQ